MTDGAAPHVTTKVLYRLVVDRGFDVRYTDKKDRERADVGLAHARRDAKRVPRHLPRHKAWLEKQTVTTTEWERIPE